MTYLDTSVVVAYYVPEPLSARVQALLRAQPPPAISDLVEVEVLSALSLRFRIGDLERVQVEQVANVFANHVQGGLYQQVNLHAGHYQLARDYIARFDLPLKAPDALHLAVVSIETLTLVTADRQLARNAEALGLRFELIGP